MSDKITVKTNNGPRPLVSYNELPEKVKPDFDYMLAPHHAGDQDDRRFVKYRDSWYDTSDCDGPTFSDLAAHGFDRYASDSFWSGVAFRFFDREGYLYDDEVVVGRYYY